jgi:hypothetical protein
VDQSDEYYVSRLQNHRFIVNVPDGLCDAFAQKKEPVISHRLLKESLEAYLRRRRNGTPARPRPSRSIEAGSGVVVGGPPIPVVAERA